VYRPALNRINPHHPTIFVALIAAVLAIGFGGSTGASLALAANRGRPVSTPHHRTHSARRRVHSSAGCSGRATPSCRRTHATRRHLDAKPVSRIKRPSPATVAAAAAAASHNAVIASVLATPCPNTELIPTAGNIDAVRTAVLCLINRERAQHGEAPLVISTDLERAGEEHGQELVADDYFAHVTPSGVTPVDRIGATGYIPGPEAGYVIGENLAWGTLSLSTPASVVAAWIASPGHLANILESQYRETGIGIVPAVPSSLGDGQQGATYAQEFGVILR
jgi:uncharacterized protein YkwD